MSAAAGGQARSGAPTKLFYFVGRPRGEDGGGILERLAEPGGSPPGWRIYRHAGGDGLALHLVEADGAETLLADLARLDPFYERGPIIELVRPTGEAPRRRATALTTVVDAAATERASS